MAAVLAGGEGARLGFDGAAAHWRIRDDRAGPIEISLPAERRVRVPGLIVHRAQGLAADLTTNQGIPLTTPVRTLIDLATRLRPRHLEAAVNEADQLDLVDPESLRRALDERAGQPGVPALRRLLDRATFTLTNSELERLFLPIARRAGLPKPETQVPLHGYRVDFHWPELGLVVETDGLRYHRTPAEQARDRRRDQTLTTHGFTVLRFTHAQVRYEPRRVERTLMAVAERLVPRPPR
jgi:very-short-patch-repair endonuclease